MDIKTLVERGSSKYSKIELESIHELEDCQVLNLTGGLNGTGVWRDYLSDLIDILDNLEEEGYEAWILSIENDVLDDVFTARIGCFKC